MMENQIRFYKRSGSCGRNNKQQQEDSDSDVEASVTSSLIIEQKDKCLIAESYYWDEEELSSGDDEIIFMKAFMAVVEDGGMSDQLGRMMLGYYNGFDITMRKVHTLLNMDDNDDRKHVLDYTLVDLR
ncbi:hypothetical protein Tco_1425997, partial [Tanacetum coccineum]